MGSRESPDAAVFLRVLAEETRRLQREARSALAHGQYTRASALIGDAELLADDVHGLLGDLARCDLEAALACAADDLREAPPSPPATPRAAPSGRAPFVLRSRRLRYAIGASLALGLALGEL